MVNDRRIRGAERPDHRHRSAGGADRALSSAVLRSRGHPRFKAAPSACPGHQARGLAKIHEHGIAASQLFESVSSFFQALLSSEDGSVIVEWGKPQVAMPIFFNSPVSKEAQ